MMTMKISVGLTLMGRSLSSNKTIEITRLA